jgi:hypothetical protein
VFDRVTGITNPATEETIVLDGDNVVVIPGEEKAR